MTGVQTCALPISVGESNLRVLLFTDTLGDVNGVARFIRNIAAEAAERGHSLAVVTSTRIAIPARENLKNLPPVVACAMPGYADLQLALPPARAMIEFAREFQPHVIHVSTPGPVGLVGRHVASRLGVPLAGVYHTDFPAYLHRLFGNDSLRLLCAHAMRWFYRDFAMVFARSDAYLRTLDDLDVTSGRTRRLQPGIRTQRFSPALRDDRVWERVGSSPRKVHVLSVGRISVEKNLPMLARVWHAARHELEARGVDAELIVVGDGPFRSALTEELADHGARFLGYRFGRELATLYASSDLFVFPSTTDTLGQVVMEAQASGLPVVVSDSGGPKEMVAHGVTGLVIPAGREADWVRSIVDLACDAPRRASMGVAAHESMQAHSIERSFGHFWSVHGALRREASSCSSIQNEPTPPKQASTGSGMVV